MPESKRLKSRRIGPRSFMGRSILMIVLPLVLLQVLISILIVQRYFNEVTKQLSSGVISTINFVENQSENLNDFSNSLKKFGFKTIDDKPLEKNQFRIFDLSGQFILEEFRSHYGADTLIDSRDETRVYLQFPTKFGQIVLEIKRAKLAPVNPHQILVNTLLLLIILLIIVFFFLRNQVRSIRYLARAAEAFGRGENIPYHPRGADEIRMAGRNFLAMRTRINRQREQRNLMLSGISHDLRTPLTRFRLSVEMLDDPETKSDMLRDVRDLEALIDSFLAYANNTATEEIEVVDLRSFMEEIVKNEPKINMHTPPRLQISVRPFLLRRAFENIINNAKRYGEKIIISFEQNRKTIAIHIDDDGPGINENDREKAIIAFKRLDQSRNQDQGPHAGLGLAITADAVRQHGGELKLAESKFGGLRASIILPYQEAP